MILLVLCAGQCVAWGTLYYGLAFLVPEIAAALGVPESFVFAGQSGALLISGVFAAPFAKLFVRFGTRTVLAVGSLAGAVSFLLLSVSPAPAISFCAILLTGIAMTFSLYEAAFSAARAADPARFSSSVSWITIVGGFASTVFWPVSSYLCSLAGWRITVAGYAVLLLVLSGVYLICLPASPVHSSEESPASFAQAVRSREIRWLAVCFSLTAFVSTSVTSHMASIWDAIAVDRENGALLAALMGPAQIAARIYAKRLSSFQDSGAGAGILSGLTGSFLVLLLALYWRGFGLVFILLFAASNGVLTLMRARAFEKDGSEAYARNLAAISAGGLYTRAFAPGLSAWVLEAGGIVPFALLCAGLGGLAVGAFALALPPPWLKKMGEKSPGSCVFLMGQPSDRGWKD